METELLTPETLAPVNGAQPSPMPVANTDFADFLSPDRTAQRFEFTMGGQECWVELLPMDGAADDRYQTLGVKLQQQADGTVTTAGEVDLVARKVFLVTYTLWDYCLKQRVRNKEGEEWYEVRPPAGDREKAHWRGNVENEVKAKFRRDKRFWNWLVQRCEQVNGQDAETAGNS